MGGEIWFATFFLVMISNESGRRESFTLKGFLRNRDRMVREQIEARGITDERVLSVMRQIPRHLFVDEALQEQAYGDHPVPIGLGQTLSQPYIVALMTSLLVVRPHMRILEIGTGSGYQAAILAALGAEVYTIEIIPELADRAAATLAAQGIDHVQVAIGDGNHGWPEAAPFAAILVTAGGSLPPALIEQLAPGGRLVIPLDTASGDQVLTLIEKDSHGTVTRRKVLPVRFVPLVGGE